MNQRIVYPNDNGGIAMLVPAKDCGLSIETIAKKDVPTGKPYLIVDVNDFPEDFAFFEAFTADFSSPHGYGANYGYGSNYDVIGWNSDETPILRETQ